MSDRRTERLGDAAEQERRERRQAEIAAFGKVVELLNALDTDGQRRVLHAAAGS